MPGASPAARPGGTDVARWRRGRPERTHPRPGMMWPRGPGRPAAKSTRGCTVQLSRLGLEMMTRLLAPRLARSPRNAGSRSERRSSARARVPGPVPSAPHGHLGPQREAWTRRQDVFNVLLWGVRCWVGSRFFPYVRKAWDPGEGVPRRFPNFPGHEKHLSASVGNTGSQAPFPAAGDSAGALP